MVFVHPWMLLKELKAGNCIKPVLPGKIFIPFTALIAAVERRKDNEPLGRILYDTGRTHLADVLDAPA